MGKDYDVLVKDQLFFGGAKDAEAAFIQESVDVVIDVRVQGLSPQDHETVPYSYKHMPIADEDSEVASSIQRVAQEVAMAYETGQKVYVHCGSGGGRAGVAATAILMELGMAESLEAAEAAVKKARPEVTIRPKMEDALQKLYK
ncbi:dual specificity protein phosphatase family protein [Lysinibacillus boronitolerans]|uniref:dual specificity protein phosphatase family protein n=1 Tax=Lysinibacillus boronitolerans TaxID=309788 RepID=UPI002163D5C0|nr:dual specificity protein phosphatase family protein [Lysinibacillus boronitolerans]MCS1391285.1 dual specificity protein phosphatase family protein [Lysinibacillus boronitolerans]